MRNYRILGLAALGLACLPSVARAQTPVTLSGHYDNKADNGFNETSGLSYTVVPGATFNNNANYGLAVISGAPSTTTINGGDFSSDLDGVHGDGPLTINGGSFTANREAGLSAVVGPVTINGGDFCRNTQYGVYSYEYARVAINGGVFGGNSIAGVYSEGSAPVTVFGGYFTNNATDFLARQFGRVTIVGYFSGLAPGQSRTLIGGAASASGISSGAFTGRLKNNSYAQIYTFAYGQGGQVVLQGAP